MPTCSPFCRVIIVLQWVAIIQVAIVPAVNSQTCDITLADRLTASDGNAGDRIGAAVATSGRTLAIGAPDDDSPGNNTGSIYIFESNGCSWVETQRLTADDPVNNNRFGERLALDGDLLVVGSPFDDDMASNAGAAYVFRREANGTWAQEAKIYAADPNGADQFGWSLDVSSDTIVVGARDDDEGASNAGAAYVFRHAAGVWTQEQKIIAADAGGNDNFGYALAIDGNTLMVGARWDDDGGGNAGAAYFFERPSAGALFAERTKLAPVSGGSELGRFVALSGDRALATAPNAGSGGEVYAFARDGTGEWSTSGGPFSSPTGNAGAEFGSQGIALAGEMQLIGAAGDVTDEGNTGAAYFYIAPTAVPLRVCGLGAQPLDEFGSAVALTASVAIVGAPQANGVGEVFVYWNFDTDDDGVVDCADNCLLTPNSLQSDMDDDGVGDLCDNCPQTMNFDQLDSDSDGLGDACDNCPSIFNPEQHNEDDDEFGDACDACLGNAVDSDLDGIQDGCDNCVFAFNPSQVDSDGDGVGEICDNCPSLPNALQQDSDGDLLGDVCDCAPLQPGYPLTAEILIPSAFGFVGPVRGMLALSGDLLVVGNPTDGEFGNNAGAAWVYRRDAGGGWTLVQRLNASDAGSGDQFGYAVEMSDGWIAVGAPYADGENDATPDFGNVYIFETSDGQMWHESQILSVNTQFATQFGARLAMDGDLLGCGGTNSAVFERQGDTWVPRWQPSFNTTEDLSRVSVDVDGDTVVFAYKGNEGSKGGTSGSTGYLQVWTRDDNGGFGSDVETDNHNEAAGGETTPVVTGYPTECFLRGVSSQGDVAIRGGAIVVGSIFWGECIRTWPGGGSHLWVVPIADALTTWIKSAEGVWLPYHNDYPEGTSYYERFPFLGPAPGNGLVGWGNIVEFDGNRLVVSRTTTGVGGGMQTLQIFKEYNGGWRQEGTIVASSAGSRSVALDGDTLAIVSASSNRVLIYDLCSSLTERREFIFVADQLDGSVTAIQPETGAIVHRFDDFDPQIDYANGVLVLNDNRILVCDVVADRIVEFNGLNGEIVQRVTHPGIQAPVDLALHDRDWVIGVDQRDIFVSGFGSSRAGIIRNQATQLVPTNRLYGGSSLDGAAGIDVVFYDEYYIAGYLYVCSQRTDQVLGYIIRFSDVSDFGSSLGISGCNMDGPADVLAFRSSLFVSSFHTDEVIKIRNSHCEPCVKAGAYGLDGPEGLARTGPNRFAVVSKNSGQILEFNAETCEFVREIASGLTRPTYMTVGLIDAPDCNGNNLPDSWDVLDGFSADANGDLVPDECQGLLVGDMNCDGVVSVSDIGGFVLALTDPSGYAAQFPDCNIANADTNGDGSIAVSDIGPMVSLLVGG